ncbi:DUF1963 domain-containing protein [Flaviaesturariibacter amylovorans]|uniref:YwqG family protein n=1 Tax=Flaviaesturariibacter amylovorans TaxID=1084520 RepID=A0ABP8HR56_9BACT
MNLWKKWFGPREPKNDPPAAPEDLSNEERAARALAQLEPFKRTAYLPRTEEVPPAFSEHSKFGGYPYLRDAADWPRCPHCGRHLQLFLQLDARRLPPMGGKGLIQLFYCTTNRPDGLHCEYDCNAYEPFSKSVVARRIDVGGPSAATEPDLDEVFPERRITGWTAADDYPHYEEHEALGLMIDDDDYEVLESEVEKGVPLAGDKLYGWPLWVQSEEYPYDRQTGKRMELLFQIDSEVNLPYMFGDSGIGHLTVSPDNDGELAFAWACH